MRDLAGWLPSSLLCLCVCGCGCVRACVCVRLPACSCSYVCISGGSCDDAHGDEGMLGAGKGRVGRCS